MPCFDASSQNCLEEYFCSAQKQSQALSGASKPVFVFVFVLEELAPKELQGLGICVRGICPELPAWFPPNPGEIEVAASKVLRNHCPVD